VYHENKPLVRKIQAHTFRPYVFHMCWTTNRVDKLVYFKDLGLWYLPEESAEPVCSHGTAMLAHVTSGKGGGLLDKCCQRQLYWPPETEADRAAAAEAEAAAA
jgi:hypothetical protein